MEATTSFLGTIHFRPSPSCCFSLYLTSSKIHLYNSSPSAGSPRSSTSLISCFRGANSSVNVLPESSKSPREEVIYKGTPKRDETGRFCRVRASRELALMIIYASCLEGSNPVRLFEKRVSARREASYEFDRKSLMEYNHMSFAGPPVIADSFEEAKKLLLHDEKESAIEAEVLSAPPKLVYHKSRLRFTRQLLMAVEEKWEAHVAAINKIAPPIWKNKPAGRILEFSILHMAMAEMTVLGTRHQIVINEAVDLAKRFCDGDASRIINGCLKTFLMDLSESHVTETHGSR